ncbi:MAG: hypothetical protein M3P51_03740, partial [Chloroflexota bacterium]|nr:hypothetical protein [Chloroflexota bacterium]
MRRITKRHARQDLRPVGLRQWSDEVLGRGFFNEVRAVGAESVVKVARPFGPLHQPIEWLVRNRAEHVAAARYFPVPRTYHVRMRAHGDLRVNVILQERLQGRMLSQVPDAELSEPVLRESLVTASGALHKSARRLGWLPDVIGGPPRWGMHDLRYS